MAGKDRITGPGLVPVAPRDLVATDPDALGPEALIEGALLDDADLSGRDLRGLHLLESVLRGVTLHEASLIDARQVEVVWDRVAAAALKLAGGTLRDVVWKDCRLGSAEAYGAELQRLEIRGGKVDFLNLRGARVRDVLIRDCIIGELDLGQASVTRLAFESSRVATLDVTGATLADVDLRGAELSTIVGLNGLAGATLSHEQLIDLAPALAEQLRIRVE